MKSQHAPEIKTTNRHLAHLEAMKSGHKKEMANQESQYKSWLDKKDREQGQFCKDFEGYHKRKKTELKQYEGELLAL